MLRSLYSKLFHRKPVIGDDAVHATKEAMQPIQKKSDFSNGGILQSIFINGSGNQIFFDKSVSTRVLVSFYNNTAPVHTAVNLIASSVASLTCQVINKNDKTVVENHPVLQLLGNPNSLTEKTKTDLLRNITLWWYIEGDYYLSATGALTRPPLELFLLNPLFVHVDSGHHGHEMTIRYNVGHGHHDHGSQIYTNTPETPDIFIEESELAELSFRSTFNSDLNGHHLTGKSLLQPTYPQMQMYQSGITHNNALLENGASPEGVLTLKGTENGQASELTEETYARLREELENRHKGTTKSGRQMILEAGLEWQQIALSPKDMDYLKALDAAKTDIFNNLGVPIELLMGKGTTFNNKREARQGFYEDTVLPFARDVMHFLTHFLLRRYPNSENLEIVIDEDKIEALAIKREAKRLSIESSPTRTINEKRKLQNLPPIEGGDKIVTQSGVRIAGTPDIGETPDTPEEPEEDDEEEQEEPEEEAEDEEEDEKKKIEVKQEEEIDEIDQLEIDLFPEQIDETFNEENNAEALALLIALYLSISNRGVRDLAEDIGRMRGEEPIDVDSIEAIKTLARKQATECFKLINGTSLKALKNQVKKGRENGETPEQIEKRMRDFFKKSQSPTRLITIGESEITMLRANSRSVIMDEANVEGKQWSTQKDKKVRRQHAELEGQVQPLDSVFTVPSSGETAQAPSGFSNPELNFGCRCEILPVLLLEEPDEKSHRNFLQELIKKAIQNRNIQEDQIKKMYKRIFKMQENILLRIIRDAQRASSNQR